MITRVEVTRRAERDLPRAPRHIAAKLRAWVAAVESFGLEEVREVPGFHDEPLRGQRTGQRSIRLSRSWRAIYMIKTSEEVQFVSVEEVTHHGY